MASVSVGAGGASGSGADRFPARYSAFTARASLMQADLSQLEIEMLSPPNRSWMNHLPEDTLRGSGIFILLSSFMETRPRARLRGVNPCFIDINLL